MQLCQEEIELDRQEVVGQAVDEASAEEVGVVEGWGATDLDPALVGSVFAPIVGRGYHIRWPRLAMIWVALNVEQKW